MTYVFLPVEPFPIPLDLGNGRVIERNDRDLIIREEGSFDTAIIGCIVGRGFYLTIFWRSELISDIEEALARVT